MKIKNLKEGTKISEVRVKIPRSTAHGLPPRNYYYVYSITGFVTWVKTRKNSDRVYPIQMMSSQVLNLEIYKQKKIKWPRKTR